MEDLCASPEREQHQSVGNSWLSSEAKQGNAALRLVPVEPENSPVEDPNADHGSANRVAPWYETQFRSARAPMDLPWLVNGF